MFIAKISTRGDDEGAMLLFVDVVDGIQFRKDNVDGVNDDDDDVVDVVVALSEVDPTKENDETPLVTVDIMFIFYKLVYSLDYGYKKCTLGFIPNRV